MNYNKLTKPACPKQFCTHRWSTLGVYVNKCCTNVVHNVLLWMVKCLHCFASCCNTMVWDILSGSKRFFSLNRYFDRLIWCNRRAQYKCYWINWNVVNSWNIFYVNKRVRDAKILDVLTVFIEGVIFSCCNKIEKFCGTRKIILFVMVVVDFLFLFLYFIYGQICKF